MSSLAEIYKSRAVEFAKEAVREDLEEHYERAVNLYTKAISYLIAYKKVIREPQIAKHVVPKIQNYLERAEALKRVLRENEGVASDPPLNNENDGAKTTLEPPVDVDEEMRKLVGLKELKSEVLAMRKELLLDKRRVDLGLEVARPVPPHMAFYGNPGTGKTRVARLIGQILRSLNVVSKGHLIEVQRSDLVAGFVGQTATKTRKVIESAKGGVLFIDEAYRLLGPTGSSTSKDFGTEAIEELMSVMTTGDPVMIFAGYKSDLDRFFASNAGLFRRVQRHFTFPDYAPKEIARILQLVVSSKGFDFEDKDGGGIDGVDDLAQLIEAHTTAAQRSAFNGALGARRARARNGQKGGGEEEEEATVLEIPGDCGVSEKNEVGEDRADGGGVDRRVACAIKAK
eukprot:g5334.t1